MSTPAPANVPQGLWRDIEVAPLGALDATARVSVIVDGAPGAAAPTLAALGRQSYPGELIEVIEPAAGGEPAGEVLVFLAAGTVPGERFVETHARWHHAAADVVSFGPLGAEPAGPLGLIQDLTRDLTDLEGGLHLAACEGTFAVRRELYEEAGGAGTAPPGVARLDLVQRLDSAGAVFAAEPEAEAEGAAPGLARELAAACEAGAEPELELPDAAALVALPPFRPPASPRRHARPAMAINVGVASEAAGEDAAATIAGVLGSRMGDVELRVQVEESHPDHALLAAAVASDPRASLEPSSLEIACEAPFQAVIPPVAALDPRTVGDLHRLALAGDAGAFHLTVPGAAPQEAMVDVFRTGAWRRARRLSASTGEDPLMIIGRLFGERWLSGVEVSTRRHGVEEPQVTEHGPLAAATDPEHERTAHLRFRDRADDLAERAATMGRRTLVERLRARRIRQAAESVESRLEG